jgi:hypothetical protein
MRVRALQFEPMAPVFQEKRIAITDSAALKGFYSQCFRDIQQFGCKVIGKAFIKFYHPKKQASNPYTKGNHGAPTWWPLDKGVKHKEPDHILKERKKYYILELYGCS